MVRGEVYPVSTSVRCNGCWQNMVKMVGSAWLCPLYCDELLDRLDSTRVKADLWMFARMDRSQDDTRGGGGGREGGIYQLIIRVFCSYFILSVQNQEIIFLCSVQANYPA